jgi:hypothetical protein
VSYLIYYQHALFRDEYTFQPAPPLSREYETHLSCVNENVK